MIKLNDDWNTPMRNFLSKLGLKDEVLKKNITPIEIPRSIPVRIAPPKNLIKLEISSIQEVKDFFRKIKDEDVLRLDDTPIVLYIKWSRMINETLKISSLPRLHLINCSKIKEMRSAGRISRYVATSEASGMYDLLCCNNKDIIKRPLLVCQACLATIRKEYPNAISDLALDKPSYQIDMNGWFSISNKEIPGKNLFSDASMVTQGGYTSDWNEVSNKKRTMADWKCSDCKVNLYSKRELLDTHHIDGNPQNNSDYNLAVLCRVCHSNQPMHSHMKDSKDWNYHNKIILNIREYQGIK